MIPGIVLAAGASARFWPGHKLLAPFGGKAVVHWSVAAALASNLEAVYLVLGNRRDDVLRALEDLAQHPKLSVVHNPDWGTGRASSLRAGLRALPAQAAGALVYPADMPLMSTELINAVAEAFLRTGALCFPVYNQRKGHPVAFPRSWFEPLSRLQGDTSGYELIMDSWETATRLERSDPQTQFNLNAPADQRKMQMEQT